MVGYCDYRTSSSPRFARSIWRPARVRPLRTHLTLSLIFLQAPKGKKVAPTPAAVKKVRAHRIWPPLCSKSP